MSTRAGWGVHTCVCACTPVLWGYTPGEAPGQLEVRVSSPRLRLWGAWSCQLLQPAAAATSPWAQGVGLDLHSSLTSPQLLLAACWVVLLQHLCHQAEAPPEPGGHRGRFGDVLPGQVLLCGPMEQGHSASGLPDCRWPPVTCMGPVVPLGPPGPAGHCPAHPSWSRHPHYGHSTPGGGISWWCSSNLVRALPCPFPVGKARAGGHSSGQRSVGRSWEGHSCG